MNRGMTRKQLSKVLAGLLLFSLALFGSGCDKHSKQRVLTFFFTGVPTLEEKKKDEIAEAKAGEAEEEKKKTEVIRELKFFVHGPKAANECFQCHDSSRSVSFRIASKKKARDISSSRPAVSGRIVVPLKKLCVECHIAKSAQTAYEKRLVMHGPLAAGSCTFCHNPHQSRFQYMLIKENTLDLCTECHSTGYLAETEEHKKGKDCISCHNPHFGKNSFMLKKDFNEVF